MDKHHHTATALPLHLETLPPLSIVGLRAPGAGTRPAAIPAIWQRLAPFIGNIPGQIDNVAYGIVVRADSDAVCFDYLAGCAVRAGSTLPAGLERIQLPAHTCAVFPHNGPATTLSDTVEDIFTLALPAAQRTPVAGGAGTLAFFERYGPAFDPHTGSGDIEVWVPLQT